MEKASYYRIASHILKIVSDKQIHPANHLDGFIPFVAKPEEIVQEPFVIRTTDRLPDWGKHDLRDWNIRGLYNFEFEKVKCSFSRYNNGYLFRMAPPEGIQPFLILKTLDRQSPFPHSEKEYKTNYSRPDKTIWMCCEEKPATLLTRFALWMAFGLSTLSSQTIMIHASVINHEGKGILFLGESGTGKSTHTRLWQEHIPSSSLLNDDSPILRIEKGVPWIYGSPWSGKTPCYHNLKIPVIAIVRLQQAPENKITKLSSIAALGALLPSCPPAFAHDELLSDQVCRILSHLLRQIPVFFLDCKPDKAAAKLVFNTISNTINQNR